MKKNQLILGLSVMLCYLFLNAQIYHGIAYYANQSLGHIRIPTAANLQNMHFKSLTVQGALQASNVHVEKQLLSYGPMTGDSISSDTVIVYGPLTIEGIATNMLTVYGSLVGSGIAISKQAMIYGPIQVAHSHFRNLVAYSGIVTLKDSQAHNIIIKYDSSAVSSSSQRLILDGRSSVTGHVLFESGNGEIFVGKNSALTKDVVGVKNIQSA